jgi:hypothetical protein
LDITLVHDAEGDFWTLRYGATKLQSAGDIVAWRTAVWKELEKIGTRRVDIVIDMTEFSMDPAVAPMYAPITKKMSDDHARAVVRYGKLDAKTVKALQIAQAKIGYPIKVEPDRAAALKTLETIRSTRSRGSRPSIPDR